MLNAMGNGMITEEDGAMVFDGVAFDIVLGKMGKQKGD